MLTHIHPKLPMRSKAVTKDFYITQLGFSDMGTADFDGYLMVQKDGIELHFFEFAALDPLENYGQVYIRTNDIEALYQWMPVAKRHLERKPWGQKEFSILDPDHNLLTFGQAM